MKNNLMVSYNGRKVKKTDMGLQACPSQFALPEFKASGLAWRYLSTERGREKSKEFQLY